MASGMRSLVKETAKMQVRMQKVEMADAHCHIDLIKDTDSVLRAIAGGVLTIITNGVSIATSKKAIAHSDNKNIFAAVGIDPENALLIDDDDLDNEINELVELVKENREKIVAIGEIGLDFTKAKSFEQVAKQRTVFERLLDFAQEMRIPVSVHSRESMNDVLTILKEKGVERVHLHFFEGNVQQAKEAERLGYMISIPPVESTKRKAVIKDVAIDSLMVESDSPVVGATPKDVEKSITMIAQVKGISFERAAEAITLNTKRFFNVHVKTGIMRA